MHRRVNIILNTKRLASEIIIEEKGDLGQRQVGGLGRED